MTFSKTITCASWSDRPLIKGNTDFLSLWGLAQVNYGALDIAHLLGVRSTNTISLSVALTQFPLSVAPTQIPHIFSTEWDWIAGGEVMVLTGSLVVK